ncbi:MAG: hypothetical protein RR846_01490 [Oscillospiraceae bacterium]
MNFVIITSRAACRYGTAAQCLEKLALFSVRTFEWQIAPLRCGGGCAALTNLRLVNLRYNNLTGGCAATVLRSSA